MCGIFALLNISCEDFVDQQNVKQVFNKGKRRGPENSKLLFLDNLKNLYLSFVNY